MTLNEALRILIRVHTDNDTELGFRVIIGADPNSRYLGPTEDYEEAWHIVRNNVQQK